MSANRWIGMAGMVCAILAWGGDAAPHMATGVVFLDMDGNGLRDAGEPGLAGVLVSNGVEVVRTDAGGRYVLPVGDDTALFVIQPSGYRVPVDADNLPRFYYLHKPHGSPPLRHAGVAPTGPLPESVNFPLSEAPAGGPFRALLISDPQPKTPEEVRIFGRVIVDELENLGDTAFALVLGDIVSDDLELFGPYIREIRRIGVPVWHVLGNHDINFDAPDERRASETFQRHFGPPDHAFKAGGVCFVVLDNVRYPLPPESGRSYVGGFRPDQLAFVENLLARLPEEMPVVLAMHIPLFAEEPFGETFRLDERRRLFALLEGRPHTLSLSGHTHTQRHHYFRASEGWHGAQPHHHYNVGTASGSWWGGEPDERGLPVPTQRDGTPHGWAFLRFDGAQYTIDYQGAGRDPDDQMRVHIPNFIYSGEWQRVITVNVFNGCELGRTEYRLGPDQPWQTLGRRRAVDPVYAAMVFSGDLAAQPRAGHRLPDPVPVHHLWSGRLPAGMEPGPHTAEVRYTDRSGRTFHARRTFTVLP